jgi:hypothetical protein
VTNNNGFLIGWLDLLPPLQLQPIITAHNQWPSKTRSISYWTTSVFSSTLTDLVPIYKSVTSSTSVVRWLTLHSWTLNSLTNDEFRTTAHSQEWTELTLFKSPCLTVPVILFFRSFVSKGRCLLTVAQHWTSASVRCYGNVRLASHWLATDIRSGSTIPTFRRHVTIRV